jgi:hypothetical protein
MGDEGVRRFLGIGTSRESGRFETPITHFYIRVQYSTVASVYCRLPQASRVPACGVVEELLTYGRGSSRNRRYQEGQRYFARERYIQ